MTTSYLTYDVETDTLVSGTKVVGSYEVGLTAAIFLLMSGVKVYMISTLFLLLANLALYVRKDFPLNTTVFYC